MKFDFEIRNAKDFWLFISAFMVLGAGYLFGANKLINWALKIMDRRR